MTTEAHGAFLHRMTQELTFDQLYAVQTIASTGSFREAGRILCLTQPAISRRVRHIEEIVGGRIFERHAGVGVTLAPLGERLLEFCDQSIRNLDELAGELAAGNTPSTETAMTVAGPSDLLQYVLAPALVRLGAQKTVRLVQSVDRDNLVSMMESGKADIGFDRTPTNTTLHPLARMREELQLVAPPGHPLLDLPVPERPASLRHHPFASYSTGMRSRDLILRWATRIGGSLSALVEARNVSLMKECVLHFGIMGVLPRAAVGDAVEQGDLVPVEIDGMPLSRTSAIAVRDGDETRPDIREFVQAFISLYEQHPVPGIAPARWVES